MIKPDYSQFPDVERAYQYALSVVGGDIPASKLHKLACQRHLDDLEKDWGYWYCAEEAQRVCTILQLFTHTKGQWMGKPFTMEDWQCFIVCSLFGWLKKSDNLRRFREAFLLVPRKNGKSILAAAIGNYMHSLDGENGAEIYCGASTEKQAWEVFGPAKIMAKNTPNYVETTDIHVAAKRLVRVSDNSRFEPVVGDPADGASPSCFILDERHEHKNDNMYDTARTGMGARQQPLLISITTAGSSVGGVCYRQQKHCEKVLEGGLEDEQLFVVIFGIDDEDDWTDPSVLAKANPNMGISVLEDYLAAQQKQAIQDSSKASAFQTKHLNRWVGASTTWMNMPAWSECGDDMLGIDEFLGSDAIRSIDLASRNDFACYLKVFPVQKDKKHYYVFPQFYLPEETIQNDKTGRLRPWMEDGWLISTEGSEIDFEQIENDVVDDESRFKFNSNVYDAWQGQYFATNLKKKGIDMSVFGNSPRDMTEPMDELMAAVLSGRVIHNNNPIMNWMMSNVIAKSSDGGDTFKPAKEDYVSKIDGPVCLIMAIGAALKQVEKKNKTNVYQNRGIRTL